MARAKARARGVDKPKPTTTPTVPRNPALEAAVLDQPDDLDALGVYADWLQATHQPLGEVIVLAIAAERDPRTHAKTATEALVAYIEQHLVPKYPKLAARMLSFKLKPNRKGRDKIRHGQTLSIIWRHGLIDSIGTWQWTPEMNDELFDLLLDDHHAMRLWHLESNDRAIDDLSFVSKFLALEGLILGRADLLKGLEDLSPLAGLSRLAALNIRGSDVTDLTPIAKLPLRMLLIGDCPVSDLSPLTNHPTLEYIDLHKTRVKDVGPLLNCPRFWQLWGTTPDTWAHADELVAAMKRRKAKRPKVKYLTANEVHWGRLCRYY